MKKYLLTFTLILSMLLILYLWYSYPDRIIARFGEPKGPGEYGDIFGAINALFTSLAFALLIYTALMQREELKLQREELHLTREELRKSADAQKELMEVTKANFEFQVETRKHEIFPEFRIHLESLLDLHPNKTATQLSISPKFFALLIMDIQVKSSGVFFDQKAFETKYLNRVINIGDYVLLSLEYSDPNAIRGTVINLFLRDVNGKFRYTQQISHDGNSFHAFGSIEMPSVAKFVREQKKKGNL
jgi:hypothetical protein